MQHNQPKKGYTVKVADLDIGDAYYIIKNNRFFPQPHGQLQWALNEFRCMWQTPGEKYQVICCTVTVCLEALCKKIWTMQDILHLQKVLFCFTKFSGK